MLEKSSARAFAKPQNTVFKLEFMDLNKFAARFDQIAALNEDLKVICKENIIHKTKPRDLSISKKNRAILGPLLNAIKPRRREFSRSLFTVASLIYPYKKSRKEEILPGDGSAERIQLRVRDPQRRFRIPEI